MITLMLGAHLAQHGHRVLLVDCDPQANLSRRVGYAEQELAQRPSVSEAIRDASPDVLAAAILPCQWEEDWADRIDIVPARKELQQRSAESGMPASWTRLKRALAAAEGYDHVLIDTPPELGPLVHNALVASQWVVMAADPEFDAYKGIHRLQEFLAGVEGQALGITARIAGIVINHFRTRVTTHEERLAEARATWGDLVWSPPVPLTIKIQNTSEFSEPPQAAGPDVQVIAEEIGNAYLRAVAA
ncbi:ParA family protein [Thermobispora bispora]|uniref:ParA family protein n=1 Tax=Thermobispora bispora TaxID=2006 RepID=UPI001981E2DE